MRKTLVSLTLAVALVPVAALARGNPGRGGGGGGPPTNTTELGNNLSNPAIFAEGIGITGLSSETANPSLDFYKQTWTGLRIPADGNPTLPVGAEGTYCTVPITPCPEGYLYYLQGIEQASWQASWIDGRGVTTPYQVNVKWGDNLFGTPWTTTSTIHVEVSMKEIQPIAADSGRIFFPTISLYGSGSTETFGSTAVATDAVGLYPGVYSESAYLLIQQLDKNKQPVGTVHVLATWARTAEGRSTTALTPEVNASGNVVYSYNWFTGRDSLTPGFYRLTFGVLLAGGTIPGITATAPEGNASIVGVVVPSDEEGGVGTTATCGSASLPDYLACSTASNVGTLDLELVAGSTKGGGKGRGGGGVNGNHGGNR